jgi:GTP-binding protein EngB required for normal cell division
MEQENDTNEAKEVEEYRNEHGLPTIEFLTSLSKINDEESIEKLRSIAEDLNVECDTDTPQAELIERIRQAVERNQEVGLEATT